MLWCNGSRRERLQRTLSSIRDRTAARLTEVAWEMERDRRRMSEVGTDDKYFIAKQTEMTKKKRVKQQRVGRGWTHGWRERERGGDGTRDVRGQESVTEAPKQIRQARVRTFPRPYIIDGAAATSHLFYKCAEPHTQQRLRFGVWVHKRVVQKSKLKNWHSFSSRWTGHLPQEIE